MPSANTATALGTTTNTTHQHHTTPHTNTTQHHTPTPTPYNTTTTPHTEIDKKSRKKRFKIIQKQQKIEENHVMWHPWAIPGHSWGLLGRPRGSKGAKETKNVVRDFPFRDLFWSTFRSKIVFVTKKCLPEACFLRVVVFIEFWSDC